MPNKIINVSTVIQSISVVGECIVENQKDKMPLGRDFENKEGRRQIFEDHEEAISWVNITQDEIDEIWSQLANDMEEEVLSRY